jgi:hypothetical protein
MEHWLSQVNMTKMSRTLDVRATACSTSIFSIGGAHPWVENTAFLGLLVSIQQVFTANFSDRHLPDLLVAEDAKSHFQRLFERLAGLDHSHTACHLFPQNKNG